MIRRLIFGMQFLGSAAVLFAVVLGYAPKAWAAPPIENPKSGSIGIEGRIPSAPPTQGATITTPTNGQSFTRIPITVSGLCPKGLLVKIFANNVFVGSVACEKGSYTIQIDLFSGQNDLVARVFDSFDQPGPDSNTVTVTFNDAQFNPFGFTLLSLTSNYAERGANPGQILAWPIILNGGIGPYAISVDWGDSKAPDLISQQFVGTIDLKHIYDSAGRYRVVIKATDKNGFSAYLQLVATANGAVTADTSGEINKGQPAQNRVLWVPAAASIPLVLISFWLGKRYELAALRKQLEQRDSST